MHDIYDPPPVPDRDWTPPEPERLVFTAGDLMCLMILCGVLFAGSVLLWRTEPELVLATSAAGSLVILESWFTALGLLHRTPQSRIRARWLVFLTALAPWVIGIGVTVSAILSIFWVFDKYI
jgi:hypothetical protein